MLEKIILNNYTTFIQPTEIDFTATNYKFLSEDNVGENKILKGCLFVGENASGKTMILKSIKLLLDLLFGVLDERVFFRYKSFYAEDTCSLEYVFLVNKKEIRYYFEFDTEHIVSEKLVYDNKEVINRLESNAKIDFVEKKSFKDLSLNRLFLRRVYFDTEFYGDKTLNKWFKFLQNSIYINCFDHEVYSYAKNLSIHDAENVNLKSKINEFFNRINYNEKIDILESKEGKSNIVVFNKKGTKVSVIEYLESTGNRTLVEILPMFLYSIENASMIIYDEFSSGLHNELEESLIKYFFHYAKDSQLFFTSHSTNILNNTILRPDQVYSVNFDSKKGAIVKRFSLEMPRESQNLEKMYLNGVFDGMPRYNKIFKD